MATIDELQIELSADTTKAIASISKLEKAFEGLKNKASADVFGNLSSQVNSFADSVRDSVVTIKELADSLRTLSSVNVSKAMESARVQINPSEIPSIEGARTTEASTDEVVETNNALMVLNNNLTTTQKEFLDVVESARLFKQELIGASNIPLLPDKKYEPIDVEFRVIGEELVQEATESVEHLQQVVSNVDNTEMPINRTNSALERLRSLGTQIVGVFGSFGRGTVNTFRDLNRHIAESTNVTKAFSNAMREVNRSTEKTNTKLKNFIQSIERIIKYRAVRTVMSAISKAMKEGTENLYFYSKAMNSLDSGHAKKSLDQLATTSLKLKNTFGVTMVNLLNIVAPILEKISALIIKVANALNSLLSALSGKNTFTVAKDYAKEYAEETKKASKATKEWKNQLLAFDEINKLTDDDNKDSGSGSDTPDYSQMFEEKDIVPWWADLEALGQKISDKLADALEKIDWNKIYRKAQNFGKGLADFLNGLINPRLFYDLGMTIANSLNTALNFLNEFGTQFDWKEFGQSIASGINGVFENFNFKLLAHTLNNWVDGIKLAIKGFFEDLNWKAIFKGLYDFFSELEIDTITFVVGAIAVKNLAKVLPKFIANLLPQIASGVASFTMANPVALTIAVGVSLTALLVAIDSANIQKAVDQFEQEQLEKYGDKFQNIYDKASQTADEVQRYNEAVRSQLETSSADVKYLETVAEKYVALTDKQSLSRQEMELAQNYTKILINGLPELQNYYNTETGLLETTRGTLEELLFQKEKEIKLNASQEAMTKNLEQQIQLQSEIKTNVDNLAKARAELESATNEVNKAEANGTTITDEMKEAVQKAMDAVDAHTGALIEQKNALSDLENQGEYLEQFYENMVTATYEAGEGADKKFGEGILANDFTSDALDQIINDASTDFKEKAELMGGDGYDALVGGFQEKANERHSDMTEVGKSIVDGIAEGVENADFKQPTENFFQYTWRILKDVFKFGSPAKTMIPIGEYITQGIGVGLTKDSSPLTNAISKLLDIASKKWDELKQKTDAKWQEVSQVITSKLGEMRTNTSMGVQNIESTFTSGGSRMNSNWQSIWSNISSTAQSHMNSIASGVSNFAQSVSNVLNSILSALSTVVKNVSNTINSIGNVITQNSSGTKTTQVKKYASGGFPSQGQLFIANEQGAEMVGSMDGKTAVANNQEITKGIREAVLEGMVQASMIAKANSGNDNNAPYIENTVMLDTDILYRAVERGRLSHESRYHTVTSVT